MRIIVLFILILQQISVFGQSKIHHIVYNTRREEIGKYQFDPSLKYFTLESKFSSDSLISEDVEMLRVLRVDYIYTKFKESEEFNQYDLDKVRLTRFFQKFPSLYKNDLVTWNFIEQSGCNSVNECEDYFHGFVIYYQEKASKETTLKEIESIENALEEVETLIESSDSVKYIRRYIPPCAYPKLKISLTQLVKKYRSTFNGNERIKGKYTIQYRVDKKGKITEVVLENYKGKSSDQFYAFLKKNLAFTPARLNKKEYEGIIAGTISFPLTKKSFEFNTFKFPEKIYKKYQITESKK